MSLAECRGVGKMPIAVMELLEEAPQGNLPADFRALYDALNRAVPGEQKNALSQPPGLFSFHPYQAICAGCNARHLLFGLSTRASLTAEQLFYISFDLRRGEGLLAGSERFHRLVELTKTDSVSEIGA